MRFGYLAGSMKDIVEHIRTVLVLEARTHLSRGMKNPHDAFIAGYNQAVFDVTQIMEQTTFTEDGRP